jgi:tryptophan synthase alpha chain
MNAQSNCENRFDILRASPRKLIACYFPVADPMIGDSIRDAYAYAEADILELGIPTRNPHLDGPDVAGTMRRAFESPTDCVARVVELTAWSRADASRPATVCMAYPDLDFDRLALGGGLDQLDGLLLLGLEERPDHEIINERLHHSQVRRVGFVPADFEDLHVREARTCEGYVMLQAAPGVTGPRNEVDQVNRNKIAALKAGGVEAPILLGFGISTADQAREACDMGADGVVIGSECVRKALQGPAALSDFVGEVRRRLDA